MMGHPFRKRLIGLVKVLVVSLTFVILTTYGWCPLSFHFQNIPSLKESAQRLKATVHYLSENIGVRNYAAYENLEAAAQYVERSFEETGFSVEAWPYEAQGYHFRNIVVRLKNNASEDYLVVGAHYDSCFTPGADDNATGIAALLELARGLKAEKLKRNIMLVAFVNEEPPFFQTSDMGSRVFVRQLRERGIAVRAAIVFDMLGFYIDKMFSQRYLPLLGPFYPNQGNFIALVGDFSSWKLVDSIDKAFNAQKLFPLRSVIAPRQIPGINFSDHASFWEVGIPAVMVTDTAYLRNRNYHRPTDTIETVDFAKMAAVVEGLKKTIVRLAE